MICQCAFPVGFQPELRYPSNQGILRRNDKCFWLCRDTGKDLSDKSKKPYSWTQPVTSDRPAHAPFDLWCYSSSGNSEG